LKLAAATCAAALLACAGCTKFEHPIVAETGPALDEALVGRWEASDERGSIRIEVARDGDAGRLTAIVTEKDRPPETEAGRLITARVDRQTFASFSGEQDGAETWTLVRYELHGPDRLSIYLDNNRFWDDAVRNRLVTGAIDEKSMIRTATVTASSEELRRVVQGYGSVIFDDRAQLELARR
jgi:hypothetical protein